MMKVVMVYKRRKVDSFLNLLDGARYGLRPHEATKVVALVQRSGSEYRFSNSDIDISLIYPDPTSLGRSSFNVSSHQVAQGEPPL